MKLKDQKAEDACELRQGVRERARSADVLERLQHAVSVCKAYPPSGAWSVPVSLQHLNMTDSWEGTQTEHDACQMHLQEMLKNEITTPRKSVLNFNNDGSQGGSKVQERLSCPR